VAARAVLPLPDPSTIVGNCGEVRIGEFGCSDAQCEACVCGENPSCCSAPGFSAGTAAGGTGWDSACVFTAVDSALADCSTACLVSQRRAAPLLSSSTLAAAGLALLAVGTQRLRRRISR
jgi:hypothetical protein